MSPYIKALKQAVKWTLIPRNLAEYVDPPKVPRKEINSLSEEQVKRLLETAQGDKLEALYVLAVHTGMREIKPKVVDRESVKNVVYLPFEVFEEENRRWRVGGKEYTDGKHTSRWRSPRSVHGGSRRDRPRGGQADAHGMAALKAEADAYYVEALSDERDERGHAFVRRNGYAREREVMPGAGSVAVKAPRVDDRGVGAEGRRRRFKSAILPPYMRRSPKVSEVLPLLYLHGLSTGDFAPALEEFFGSSAGLSPSTITRLAEQWQQERERFMARYLSERDYVYVWADGVHTGVRLGSQGRLCCLVVVGARLDGTKELVAIEDGYRESEESWANLLRSLKKRGMRSPELCVGDGALGLWAALREVFPESRHQRDWVHKVRNVLDSLPKSVHRRAKAAMKEITHAENEGEAKKAIEAFASQFGVKWPKAVEKVVSDREALLAFYDYPAELWIHLRTSNPIESVFAPVRARTDITKGPGSRAAGLAMIFKLMEAAEGRWRKLNGHHLVALVRAGAKFRNGELVEGEEEKKAAA